MARAKQWEHTRDHAAARLPNFEYSEALYRIAIVLGSVAIVAASPWLLGLSGMLAVFGLALTINGYLLLVPLPHGDMAHPEPVASAQEGPQSRRRIEPHDCAGPQRASRRLAQEAVDPVLVRGALDLALADQIVRGAPAPRPMRSRSGAGRAGGATGSAPCRRRSSGGSRRRAPRRSARHGVPPIRECAGGRRGTIDCATAIRGFRAAVARAISSARRDSGRAGRRPARRSAH